MKERLEILKIHVKEWTNPPPEHLLEVLADKATGYCGSDLKALCTEAVIQGLKRTYPQIYLTSSRLLLNPARVEVKKADFVRASSLLVPSSHRVTPCVGRRLAPYIEPLLESSLHELLATMKKIFPQGTNHALAKYVTTIPYFIHFLNLFLFFTYISNKICNFNTYCVGSKYQKVFIVHVF